MTVYNFDLTSIQGRWKYNQWGLPYFNAASGAELRSYFLPEAIEKYGLDQLFKRSSYALSGLFCSSLEFMNNKYNDSDSFIRPFHLYRPEAQIYEGDLIFRSKNSHKNNMRHAILEGEPVCTENLTPWIKMLPNRAKSGISKLFSAPWNALRSDFYSIGVHYDKSIKNLKLTLVLVVNENFFENGDILNYFEVKSITAPPLSKRSVVHLKKNPHYTFSVNNEYEKHEKDDIISYTLNENPFKVYLRRLKGFPQKKVNWIKANRWTVGWGQQYGTLSLLFENSLKKSLNFVYYQSTPWFMKLYFHTMKFYLNGKLLNEEESKSVIRYVLSPSVNREKATQLEFYINLKPSEKLLITIDFDKTHLHWTEYNFVTLRGFDIGSGLLSVNLDKELRDYLKTQEANGFVFGFGDLEKELDETSSNVVIYSDIILLTCPVPDFSMPYNVIILSSTVVAIFFGSMLSTLTRKYKDIYKDNKFHSDKFFAVVLRKIKNVMKRN